MILVTKWCMNGVSIIWEVCYLLKGLRILRNVWLVQTSVVDRVRVKNVQRQRKQNLIGGSSQRSI